jgi:hypothetical protein
MDSLMYLPLIYLPLIYLPQYRPSVESVYKL